MATHTPTTGTIVVFAGTDRERLERALEELRAKFVRQYGETDVELVHGPALTSAAELQALVETRAFFGGKRLVIVRDLSQHRSPRVCADVAELLDRLRESPTVLVFVEERTFDMRKASAFVRAIFNEHYLQRFAPPSAGQLATRITQSLTRDGVHVGPGAAMQLAQDIGEELDRLPMELAKLRDFKLGDPSPLTAANVQQLVRPQLHANVFALTDALGARDVPGIVRSAEVLRAVGESGMRLHAMLTNHVRNLLLARDALDRGLSAKEATSALTKKPYPKLHQYVAEKTVRQAARTVRAELQALFHALRSFDVASKTGGVLDLESGLIDLLIAQTLPPAAATAAGGGSSRAPSAKTPHDV